jgi:RNA polymerase sigma factor (TIGR02999 family)
VETTFSGTLRDWRNGDATTGAELARLVYHELHRMARQLLRQEKYAHSLNPTALINETWLRLFGGGEVKVEDRHQFFLIAARQMRQFLIDRARRATAHKRIRRVDLVSLEKADRLWPEPGFDLLALEEALEQLEQVDVRACRVVELRFFGGLDEAETAQVLGISPATLRRDWAAARLWLYGRLKDGVRGSA